VADHTRSPRQRIHGRIAYLRSLLDAIDERAARADTSTLAPTTRPHDRVQTSGYADPTSHTVASRDQVLGQVELDLWSTEHHLEQTAARLRTWAPNSSPDDRCTCPPQCCPDGCTRTRTDNRDEHPTCRSKRARARRRGEPWATVRATA
jgi:hypothetical protein